MININHSKFITILSLFLITLEQASEPNSKAQNTSDSRIKMLHFPHFAQGENSSSIITPNETSATQVYASTTSPEPNQPTQNPLAKSYEPVKPYKPTSTSENHIWWQIIFPCCSQSEIATK